MYGLLRHLCAVSSTGGVRGKADIGGRYSPVA